jgi:DNA-binding CsgD family transcriptional regulator
MFPEFGCRRTIRLTSLQRDLVLVCVDEPKAESLSRDEIAVLSAAERAVVELAARGLSNERIANQRGVAPRTIANQLGAAYCKLGISSRRELGQLLKSGRASR